MLGGTPYAGAIPMDLQASFSLDDRGDQERLLQDDLDEDYPRQLPPPKNSKQALLLMGIAGGVVFLGALFMLMSLLFGSRSATQTGDSLAHPTFGDIGCVFPNEVISPTLVENLTLHDNSLEIRASGRGIGDIAFFTEKEVDLPYVNMDVFLQGQYKSDLQQVYTRAKAGLFELQTPETATKGCIRYTLNIHLPRKLKTVLLRTAALTHITFANVELATQIDLIHIRMLGDAANNLLYLPEARIRNTEVDVQHGFVVGTSLLYETVNFNLHQAQADVEFVAMAGVNTVTGLKLSTYTTTAEKTKFVIRNPKNLPMHSLHESLREASLSLQYPAAFAGLITITAQSFSARQADVHLSHDSVPVLRGEPSHTSLTIYAPEGDVELAFNS
ncbi:hypothetical protein BCR37DRAFT_392942 [Protomyces lactucae-debilis]|uniref:Uncharacterized protein n=1 Tax=Protomyces lactucae-debilis TaxID=2754530 RepID=A0A1Y2FD86_PROLT|nr:uncharacterized protein BCR37DRAFT_392942 [Protomyces lactucae-debilis]ORY81888.1 hypothetical protein BCR37DRAFT_392942 [Protomyces lactucae-debilis]